MKSGPTNPSESTAFLRGDASAVGEVRAAVRAVVRSFQFEGRDTERDLVQEVMRRVLQNLDAGAFRGEATLRTYAQRVAKYACLEHIRRQRAEVRVDFEAIPSEARWSAPEEALLQEEEHARNLKAIAALPRELRGLLKMVFVDGLTYGEAARRLGVAESTIKSRVHRIRRLCRDGEVPAAGPRAGGRRPERVEG